MGEIRKLRVVRAIVRPDRRDEYLERWRGYAATVTAVGVKARLYEDQMLPGRFCELTEHLAGEGMEGELERAFEDAGLRRLCVRREGDDELYRPVAGGGDGEDASYQS